MASTYVNNLRLEEIGSGEQSGSWGDTTNTNLEIIGQAVAWGTRAIANASTDNITITDGALDADRCLGLKLTGGGQACTVTLLPNTSSKTWFMYNATAAALTFTCGSGANVIIPANQTKVIATDGLGSGGVVHDLLTAVNLAGTTTVDDLVVSDDLVVGDDLGVTGLVTIGGTLGVTGVLTGTSLDISGNVDIDGTTNLDAVDIDGAVQLDATLTVGANDQGYDVTLHGDTAARNVKWDSSADSLLFTDSAKAVFGAGSDLQIFHDGSNSYVDDTATGNLYLRSNGAGVIVETVAGVTMARFLNGNACDFNFGSTTRLATTSTGVAITGAVKPTTYQETYVASSAASTVTLDLATATSFSLTMGQATTFAFSNPPGSGTAFSFTLFLTQHSTAVAITWPNTVDWAGGSAPDAAGNNEVQAYAFFTRDGGTTYYGFLGGTAIA